MGVEGVFELCFVMMGWDVMGWGEGGGVGYNELLGRNDLMDLTAWYYGDAEW